MQTNFQKLRKRAFRSFFFLFIDGSTSTFSPKPYLVMACFNGRASCNLPHEWYNSIQTTAFNTTAHVLTPMLMAPLNQCVVNITGGATGPGQAYPCGVTPYGGMPAGGSNFRLMTTTGIKEHTAYRYQHLPEPGQQQHRAASGQCRRRSYSFTAEQPGAAHGSA